MKTYEETIIIAENFYESCLRFWKGDKENALKDVARLTYDPTIPTGDKLNQQALIDFVNERLK